MEKLMKLVGASDLKTRTYQDQQGQQRVVEFFEVQFSDGIDKFVAETSDLCTRDLKITGITPNALYAVRFNLNCRVYSKDGKEMIYNSISVHQMNLMVCVK